MKIGMVSLRLCIYARINIRKKYISYKNYQKHFTFLVTQKTWTQIWDLAASPLALGTSISTNMMFIRLGCHISIVLVNKMTRSWVSLSSLHNYSMKICVTWKDYRTNLVKIAPPWWVNRCYLLLLKLDGNAILVLFSSFL